MRAMPPAMTPRKRFVFCFIITSFIQTLTVGTVVATVLPFHRLADFTAGRGLHPALKIISAAKIVQKPVPANSLIHATHLLVSARRSPLCRLARLSPSWPSGLPVCLAACCLAAWLSPQRKSVKHLMIRLLHNY
jgi:hypothetical protein